MLRRNYELDKYKQRKKIIRDELKANSVSFNDISEFSEIPIQSISAFLQGNNNSAEILIRIDRFIFIKLGMYFDYDRNEYLYN